MAKFCNLALIPLYNTLSHILGCITTFLIWFFGQFSFIFFNIYYACICILLCIALIYYNVIAQMTPLNSYSHATYEKYIISYNENHIKIKRNTYHFKKGINSYRPQMFNLAIDHATHNILATSGSWIGMWRMIGGRRMAWLNAIKIRWVVKTHYIFVSVITLSHWST